VAVTGMPKSCEDIWRIGHTLRGLYSVIGNQMVESVYCDFNKLPGESGKHFFLPYFYLKQFSIFNIIYMEKDFKNGSDTPTLNQRLSIFTSSGIQDSAQLELRSRSIWPD
jgi:hypothetical protein